MPENVFFTSDTHFWHKRILEFTDRPFDSVEDMNDLIIYLWNQTVRKTECVYHLGDI